MTCCVGRLHLDECTSTACLSMFLSDFFGQFYVLCTESTHAPHCRDLRPVAEMHNPRPMQKSNLVDAPHVVWASGKRKTTKIRPRTTWIALS